MRLCHYLRPGQLPRSYFPTSATALALKESVLSTLNYVSLYKHIKNKKYTTVSKHNFFFCFYFSIQDELHESCI